MLGYIVERKYEPGCRELLVQHKFNTSIASLIFHIEQPGARKHSA